MMCHAGPMSGQRLIARWPGGDNDAANFALGHEPGRAARSGGHSPLRSRATQIDYHTTTLRPSAGSVAGWLAVVAVNKGQSTVSQGRRVFAVIVDWHAR